jgi:hypothetical protein
MLKACYEGAKVGGFSYLPGSVPWSYLAGDDANPPPASSAKPGRAASSGPRSARSTACLAPPTAAASSLRSEA